MLYIPLDQELKVKGKVVVDLMGALYSKRLGIYVPVVFLVIFDGQSLIDLAPKFAIVVMIAVTAWFFAIMGLSKRFQALVKAKTANPTAT